MTPHNNANKSDIAKTVIMPGDPKRATFIAENFLDNYKLVNDVRGILAYTGTYDGKLVTIMASGMGMPSMAIYATELFKFYDVDRIIRVGTCGALKEEVKVNDLLLVKDAYTTSNFSHSLTGKLKSIEASSNSLNEKILNSAKILDLNIKEVRINTSDVFYREYIDENIEKEGCSAVEMETFALLYIAKHFNKDATAILTVSDSLITGESLTAEEREKNLKNAIVVALESL